jgi:transposase
MNSLEELRAWAGRDPEGALQALWKSQQELAQTREELLQKQQQLLAAQTEIAELKRQLFGSRADKLSAEEQAQMQEVLEDLKQQTDRVPAVVEQILEEDAPAKTPRSRPARHPLPAHLETQTITLEPEEKHLCPHCGRTRQCIGTERTEEIDYIPARLIRREILRPKYACSCGAAGVAIAPLPPRLIPQSKLGLGLAVYIVLTRFDDHLSFYRLEQIFRERHGVVIPRQQMVQWVEHIAQWLQPIYRRMWEQMKQGGYLQIDETPVKVLDPEVKGKAAHGFLWFYSVPGADVVLEYCDSRGHQAPLERLRGFAGTIQADGYDVYQLLERKLPGVRRNGCLAHSRRRFYKALKEAATEAIWFIAQIRRLYQIEAEVRNATAKERKAVRREKAPEIWRALKKRAHELRPKFLPRSTMGNALSYFLNEYTALVGYLRDGRFEIDQNLVENSIRPTAVGRRRWLFLGHPDAGWRSAVIYSILVSCRRRGINPVDYLTDVLGKLPGMMMSRIDALLPANWKQPGPG